MTLILKIGVVACVWTLAPLVVSVVRAVLLAIEHPSTAVDMLDAETRADIWGRQTELSLELAREDQVISRITRGTQVMVDLLLAVALWPLHLRHIVRAQRLVHLWHAGGRGFRIIPGTQTFTGHDVHIPLYAEGVVNNPDVSVIVHRRAAEGSPPLPPFDPPRRPPPLRADFPVPLNEELHDCESCGETTLSTTPPGSRCGQCGQFTATYWAWIEAMSTPEGGE